MMNAATCNAEDVSDGSMSEVGRTEESRLDSNRLPYGECEVCMLSGKESPARYANSQYIRGHARCLLLKRLPILAFSGEFSKCRHIPVLPQPTRQD